MKTYYKTSKIYGTTRALFCVSTRDRGNVFMSVAQGFEEPGKRAVVEVDASKFLNLWRDDRSYFSHIAKLEPPGWKQDYKFHWAEDGFSNGEHNPVPLAKVSCSLHAPTTLRSTKLSTILNRFALRQQPNKLSINFDNGITRTIWLLAYGAPVFPIECDYQYAELLCQYAGTEHRQIKTVTELTDGLIDV